MFKEKFNMYSKEEAIKATTEYFNGDELAAIVFVDKYALRDNDGNFLEKTPEDMLHRIAKEFARIEKKKFKIPMSEDEILNFFVRMPLNSRRISSDRIKSKSCLRARIKRLEQRPSVRKAAIRMFVSNTTFTIWP